MPAYANRSGRSNVRSYNVGPDWIEVTFKDGSTYRYTYASAGAGQVETAKQFARSGQGLNSFIVRRMKYAYSRKG